MRIASTSIILTGVLMGTSPAVGAEKPTARASTFATSATICIADYSAVYLLTSGTAKPQKLFSEKQVGDVQISPLGDAIAYTRDITKKNETPKRQIAVYDISTSKARVLASAPGDN